MKDARQEFIKVGVSLDVMVMEGPCACNGLSLRTVYARLSVHERRTTSQGGCKIKYHRLNFSFITADSTIVDAHLSICRMCMIIQSVRAAQHPVSTKHTQHAWRNALVVCHSRTGWAAAHLECQSTLLVKTG